MFKGIYHILNARTCFWLNQVISVTIDHIMQDTKEISLRLSCTHKDDVSSKLVNCKEIDDSSSVIKKYHKSNSLVIRVASLAAKSVIGFLVCWKPISIYAIVLMIGYFENDTQLNVEGCLIKLAFTNSILNPIIYLSFIKTQLQLLNCIRKVE